MRLRIAAVALCVLLAPLSMHAKVLLGIDNFLLHYSSLVRHKRVGIITNQTGKTSDGKRTIDAIRALPGVTLAVVFTPEHGLNGTVGAGENIPTYFDSTVGVPIYSLYGSQRKPTRTMLRGIDVLIYDIQDIGVRSYTLISTLGLAMQSAAESDIPFIVLDRPSPLACRVDGNVLDTAYRSFVGMYPVPYVYGLTPGELARMINEEGMVHAQCQLTIVPMVGWTRCMPWEECGLSWTPPSPNIQSPSTAAYYAAFGILGELGIGGYQGIGCPDAFRVLALASFDTKEFTERIAARHIEGLQCIRYETVIQRAKGPAHYRGVRFIIDVSRAGDLTMTGLEILSILAEMHLVPPPDSIHAAMFSKIAGASYLSRVLHGEDVAEIAREWLPALTRYRALRRKYLIYQGDQTDDGGAR